MRYKKDISVAFKVIWGKISENINICKKKKLQE